MNARKMGLLHTFIDLAGFYMALITGLQVQSVLIEELDITSYCKEIKRILLLNIWGKFN